MQVNLSGLGPIAFADTSLDSEAEAGAGAESIPRSPVQASLSGHSQDVINWFKSLQKYLFYGILANLFPDKDERKQFVTQSAMEKWERAFIHSSVNINRNYETNETIGDGIIAGAFNTFILRKHADKEITPSILTNYSSKFMSKENQRNLAHRYGLDNWLRIDFDMTPSTSDIEDIFESFCGALHLISEDLIPGSGPHNVYRFLVIVLTNFGDIDVIPKWGPAKTQIKEIYQGLKWTSGLERKGNKEYFIYEIVERKDLTQDDIQKLGTEGKNFFDRAHRCRILLTDEAKRWIIEANTTMGFKIKLVNETIQDKKKDGAVYDYYAEGLGLTQTVAGANAFENALIVLNDNGLTRNWVEIYSRKTKMARPAFRIKAPDGSDIDLYQRACTIWSRWLTQKGLVGDDVSIEEIGEKKKIQGKKGSGIFHLIGRDNKDNRYLLAKMTMPREEPKEYELQLQINLLKKYVEADGNDPVYY